jgi:hypothetical protein
LTAKSILDKASTSPDEAEYDRLGQPLPAIIPAILGEKYFSLARILSNRPVSHQYILLRFLLQHLADQKIVAQTPHPSNSAERYSSPTLEKRRSSRQSRFIIT